RRMVSRHGRDFRDGRLRRQPEAGDGAAVARGARGRTTPPLDDRAATRECGAGARELGLVVCSVPELQTPVRAECRPSDDALPAVQRGVPARAGGVVPPRRLDAPEDPQSFFAARARALRRSRVIIRVGEASTVSRISPPQGWGVRYGVCPHCAARAPLSDRATSLRCPACQMAFVIGWSDAHWRVFDLLSRSPTVQVIVKARDAALRVLKG